MTTQTIKVLDLLKKKKSRGITFGDFATGFRLGARIFDLRRKGYGIATIHEPMSNGGYRARYTLTKQPS